MMPRTTDPTHTGWATVAILMALALVSGVAMAFDHRLLNGVSVWSKPLKFEVSFALHMATLMLFVHWLGAGMRHGRLIRWTVSITSAAVLVEVLYIHLQAARGRHSHFNDDTAWEAIAYYALMGGAALVVMAGTIVIGVAIWRDGSARIGPGLRTGAAAGAILGSLATLITAGAMASGALTPTGHWVGGTLSDADGLPVLGWSTTGGDLRVAHFFSTHLVQTLPILGWLADRVLPRRPALIVALGATVGLAIVWVTFDQALSATPFLRWPPT